MAIAALALPTLVMAACDGVRGQADRTAAKDEAAAIDAVVKIALDGMQKHYGEGKRLVRRDAHAKAHGCVKAVFQVDPKISPDLAVGTFSSPGRDIERGSVFRMAHSPRDRTRVSTDGEWH